MNKQPVKRLLLPGIIYVALVTQIPFLVTIYYSLQKWNLMRPDLGMRFTWLSNFISILSDSTFYQVVYNTFVLTVGSLILCLVLGFIFALFMNRDFWGRGIVRTMLISPFFVMPTVSGILWKTMLLNPNYGLAAYFARLFGANPVDWLGHHALGTIVAMVTWQWMPFFMLLLLSGLQSVSPDVLEASLIDGANKRHQYVYVIIPHLMKYIEVAVLLGLIFIMQAYGLIYVTTSGGPGYASTNLTFFVYRAGFQGWDIGKASAIGVLIVILTVFMMTMLFKFLRRTFKGELS